MQNDRRMAFSLVALFVLSTMMPLVSAQEDDFETNTSATQDDFLTDSRDLPLMELL